MENDLHKNSTVGFPADIRELPWRVLSALEETCICDKQSEWYSNVFEVDSTVLAVRDSQHI
jgi:hypothetical protein